MGRCRRVVCKGHAAPVRVLLQFAVQDWRNAVEDGEFAEGGGDAARRAPTRPHERYEVHRCFVWIGLESNYSWNSHVEFAGSLVGDGSEVDEVPESTSHSFC